MCISFLVFRVFFTLLQIHICYVCLNEFGYFFFRCFCWKVVCFNMNTWLSIDSIHIAWVIEEYDVQIMVLGSGRTVIGRVIVSKINVLFHDLTLLFWFWCVPFFAFNRLNFFWFCVCVFFPHLPFMTGFSFHFRCDVNMNVTHAAFFSSIFCHLSWSHAGHTHAAS